MTSPFTQSSVRRGRRPAPTRVLASALAGVLAVVIGLAAGSALAESVVLSSTSPDYAAGDRLAAGATVSLPPGASLTLITRTGTTLTLDGPHEGPAPGPGGESARALGDDDRDILASLLTGTHPDLTEIGAGRAVSDPGADTIPSDPAAGPVPIDVDLQGVHCIDPEDPPDFVRADTGARAVPVHGVDAVADIVFAEGAARAPWPEALPLLGETVYRIPRDPAAPAGDPRLVLRVLDRAGRDEVDWVLALARAGCGLQAARALAAYRERTIPLGLHLSSDRGPDPVYRMGEQMELRLRTSRNAYLYCYALQADGTVLPLFPVSDSRGAGLAANQLLTVPGDRWPGRLDVVPPPGEDRVRCYAVARDVTDTLPAAVVPFDHVALPADLAGRLDSLFADAAAAAGADLAVAEIRLTATE